MSVLVDTSTSYEVDYSTSQIVNAWRTKRLEFIKIDESNEAIREFLPQVEQDPVVLALASSRVLGPQGEKDMRAQLEAWSNALLSVAICLREDVEGQEDVVIVKKDREEREMPKDQDQDKHDRAESTKSTNKPTIVGTIVGTMCLGWGGITARTAQHRTAQMGITLGKKHQNKGYGREAINWMVDWAFMHAGLHTVCLTAASYNPRGIHLYQSIGFRLEGRRKETIYFNRGWYDELDFGMTEWEWETLRGIEPKRVG
ncbi:hypothetical protein E4U55_007257 [Claviceps digitariae]|nr:hypothetical protein E4U55_007257 [Claviceps digitariae]